MSIAVPLYASARFHETIVENLSKQDYPNLEIIISDRHGLDDVLAQLRERFAGDSRFRFVDERDRLDWVTHYNDLLARATGMYFLWMPHDDSYPEDYVSLLVDRLEANPDAILAFGSCQPFDLDGNPVSGMDVSAPPFADDEPWTPRVAVRLLITWRLGLPFRGVFRRDRVVGRSLFIQPTYRNASADVLWVFGLALAGRLSFVESCRCVKRYYPESTHARHPRALRNAWGEISILRSYLRGHAGTWLDAALLHGTVLGWVLYRCVYPWLRVPDTLLPVTRSSVRALLQ